MTFADYVNRPVYVAQCVSWCKAAELNLCSLGIRALPGKRDGYAQLARDMIALSIKVDRFNRRKSWN